MANFTCLRISIWLSIEVWMNSNGHSFLACSTIKDAVYGTFSNLCLKGHIYATFLKYYVTFLKYYVTFLKYYATFSLIYSG